MDDRFGWPASGRTGRTASARTRRPALIGADRDARALTDALVRGTSTVVAGPRGSGKTFLLQRVVELLADRSIAPLVLRAAAALTDIDHGVISASSDPRAAELREGTLPVRVVLVIDDAHHLDAASAETVTRAIHHGHAAVVMAVSEPRIRGHEVAAVTHALHDLWLSGAADRLDVGGLTADEGTQLLAELTPDVPLDGMTREAILWQADGSRMLLRALADHAVDAIARGEDPIRSIDDVPPHSRLAVALQAHIREFDDDSLRALVLLGHAPGLSLGDAARFVPPAVVTELRGAGVVHDDRTTAHRLTANRAIARAAARAWGPGRAEALARDAVDRMIADGGLWWNASLARLLAERWLRESPGPSQLPDVPAELIARALADAARLANDEGDASSAAAYAAWAGADAATPVLSLEKRLAQFVLGSPGATGLDLHALPADAQRRTLGVAVPLALSIAHSATDDRGDGGVATPDSDLAEARLAIDRMQIGRARDAVQRLRARPDLDHADRIDTELLAATVSAYLAREPDMRRELRAVEWLLRGRGGGVSATEVLSARCRDLGARTAAGLDDSCTLADLDAERRLAVRTGGTSVALAGLASVLALLRRGRVLEARIELTAALRRSPLNGGEGQGVIILETVLGLAIFGHVAEARELLDSVGPPHAPTPMFVHMQHAASATISAAEGRWDDARRAAAHAWCVSAETDAVMLQIRSLHRLVVLGYGEAGAALERLRQLVEGAHSDAARVILASAERAATTADPSVTTALTHLRLDLCPPELLSASEDLERADAAHDLHTLLTPREFEIAGLVRQGLSNRQIAHTLFLSVRTVESHIYQARAKLGARNRKDLGTLVALENEERAEPRLAWG